MEVGWDLWGTLPHFLPQGSPRSRSPEPAAGASTWVAAVSDGAVADGGDSHRLPAIGQLVKDSIGADPQRAQAAEPPPERMTRLRLALQQTQGVLDSVDQRPVQLKQLATGAPSEDKPRQRSASGRSALRQLAAKLRQSDRLPALDLGKARLQRREGVGVGENLGGLLERLVLVDWDQGRRRRPIARDQNVVSAVADVVEQAAEVGAQLAHRNGLGHWRSVHDRVRRFVALLLADAVPLTFQRLVKVCAVCPDRGSAHPQVVASPRNLTFGFPQGQSDYEDGPIAPLESLRRF